MNVALKRHCKPLYAMTSWSKAGSVANTENNNDMKKMNEANGMEVARCLRVQKYGRQEHVTNEGRKGTKKRQATSRTKRKQRSFIQFEWVATSALVCARVYL